MGVVVYFVYRFMDIRGIYGTRDLIKALFVSVMSGVVVYGGVIHLMKVDEVEMLLDIFKSKSKQIVSKISKR